MPEIDPLLSLAFTMDANRGTMAVLLGSGVSRAAGIPTGWQVTLDLAERLAASMGEDTKDNTEKWYVTKFGKAPDYSDIVEAMARTSDERRGLLHGYFEATTEEREEGRKQPTAAHRAIARLVQAGHIRVILTTNFDRLMETALLEFGIEPVVISSTDGIKGAPPMAHWQCVIIKLHGDYLDPRIRNTVAELESYAPEMDQLLDRVFDEFGLIISGWSGEWDVALRSAMERCPTRRYSSLWGEPGTLGPKAADLVALRSIQLVQGLGADQLFTRLEEHLSSLAEIAERRHPLTPALAVATAKRWLAEPDKNRIRLHDMVIDEVERVCVVCNPENFPIRGVAFTHEEARSRLKRYEDATETLRTLLVTFVQWGDERHHPLWIMALKRLDGREMEDGSELLPLQRYPTLLLLYAGGIAATALGHYDWMRAILADANGWDYRKGEETSLGVALSPSDVITSLHHEKITPLSDNLFKILEKPIKSLISRAKDYDAAFDRYELLSYLFRWSRGRKSGHGFHGWRSGGTQTRESVIRTVTKELESSNLAPHKAGLFVATHYELLQALTEVINKYKYE